MEGRGVPSHAAQCCRRLWDAGFQAYPVGGCVRDLLLGRLPLDWDVAASALPEQVMALFDRTVPTGVRHGTVTVLLPGGAVEVTTFRTEGGYSDGRHPDAVSFRATLREDLARRDFTVNAMALDRDGTVIDPFGGRADLARGLLRCVGEADRRFGEDALRMFRAVRFCAQLGFTPAPGLPGAIRRNAARAAALSAERVQGELERILLSSRPDLAGCLFRLGLMTRWAKGTPAKLDGLTALPSGRLERWAGLCGALPDACTPAGAERFLSSLHLDRRLLRACTAGAQLRQEGLPRDGAGWRRALARLGRDGCRAGAAMEGAAALTQLERLLELDPCVTVGQLALSGSDLAALGLRGRAIGAAQHRLLRHVLDFPEDNRRDRLLELLDVPAGDA